MNSVGVYTIQILTILTLLVIVFRLLRLNSSLRMVRRFTPYTVEELEDRDETLFDYLYRRYQVYRKKISKQFKKSKLLLDYSKKYEKYCDNSKIIRDEAMDYISDKFVVGFVAMIVIMFSDIFQYQPITFLQLLTFYLIGFFIPDLVLISKNKIREKLIERDMLHAIIIMNNAFKSGMSIMQGIYMVYNELDGPISDEFKKMYIDITFGLNMDTVFKRFADRVKTKEAKYITTSLTVLNKTGGNIVQVFSSVERNSFTRKKLREELGAISASSDAIFKMLAIIPIFLIGIILMLNPTYFSPLFTTSEGLLILGLLILIYVLYIFIVRKVMKVEVDI